MKELIRAKFVMAGRRWELYFMENRFGVEKISTKYNLKTP